MARESDVTPLVSFPRWSFNLRQLFLWTAVIAVGCVALRSASSIWIGVMFGLTFLALATAILLVVFRRGAQRAYWIGFATFGWLYILLLFVSWSFNPTTPSDNPFLPWNLPTRQASTACYHWLYDAAFEKHFASYQPGPGMGGGYGGGMGGMSGMGSGGGMYGSGGMPMMPGAGGGYVGTVVPPGPPPGPDEGSFANVAHSLWTILLAATGGCLAHWLYATGPGRTSQLPTARA